MDSATRLAILKSGVAALEWAFGSLRALLPPPEREDPSALRELRQIQNLWVSLDSAVEGVDESTRLMQWCDVMVSHDMSSDDASFIRSLSESKRFAGHKGASAHVDALRALAELLERYQAGEFRPPPSFFEIGAAEA